MKPKTKKTMIILVAVVAVAAIVYFVFFRRGKSTDAVIASLNVDQTTKDALVAMVSYIGTTWTAEAKSQIAANARLYGRTLNSQTVVEAAYALLTSNVISADTYNSILNQI